MAAALAAGLAGLHCDDAPTCGDDAGNRPPQVRITAGAVDSAAVDYRVTFAWEGSDPDGEIAGFEWAVDDTTLEDAWTWTSAGTRDFLFDATTPGEPSDSLAHDWHRFFVRAVDDDDAHSESASRFFNAVTILPESHISDFHCETFSWQGEDLDAPGPLKEPTFWEYKLALADFSNPLDSLLHGRNLFLDTLQAGDRTAWVRVPAEIDEASVLPFVQQVALLVFGVRAVDAAGAVEASLEPLENYIVWEARNNPHKPFVTMTAHGLGSHVFPRDGAVWRVSVPARVPIRFQWTGLDPPDNCIEPGLVNYGLDVPDPGDDGQTDPDGIGGWIGWSDWTEMRDPISFPAEDVGTVHHFYLKMRNELNTPESERFCWVELAIVAARFHKTALLVDDAVIHPAFSPGGDEAHDAFRYRVTSCIERFTQPGEEILTSNLFGPGDRNLNPLRLELETLLEYRLLIWNSFMGSTLRSGLALNEWQRRLLSNYVRAGGRLYLYGSRPVGCLAGDRFDYDGDGLCPDLPGVEDPLWDENDFLWAFLHLTNCVKSISRADQRVDGWVGARAQHPLYPDVRINREIWDPDEVVDGTVRGGAPWFEVYRAGRRLPPRPEPGLDTLYAVENYNDGGGDQSLLEGHPCALRYESTPEDSAQGLAHGRVFLQTFPAFLVPEDRATEVACKAITWLMTGRDE
ncbi:MAG: hypothetical protein GF355_00010 [Candidatus Eisenbacteria bacterium]|nr:hypothetical protein [Candidatus Eisenbacteria bacterium]